MTALDAAPFYLATGAEEAVFTAAAKHRLPVLLKGPTGCGKTRFVEHMAWRTGRELVTVTCHDDMTAADLVGRYLLDQTGTTWLDGPLTRAVRTGALCYLDEVVEARKDTTVILHSLSDHRRILPLERLGETLTAHPDFQLVVSYNPGYQSGVKDLKPSTRQRFVAIGFGYPARAVEAEIIAREAGVDPTLADALALLGERLRSLGEADVVDGPSTRLLVYVATLIRSGLAPVDAGEAALVQALSDDPEVQEAVRALTRAVLPG